MKKYWPNATDIKDGVSHMLFTMDSAFTMTEAEKQIDIWKKNFDLTTAWIYDEDGLVVWHRCYVDSLGNLRR